MSYYFNAIPVTLMMKMKMIGARELPVLRMSAMTEKSKSKSGCVMAIVARSVSSKVGAASVEGVEDSFCSGAGFGFVTRFSVSTRNGK
jgi:hypothetical protein